MTIADIEPETFWKQDYQIMLINRLPRKAQE
jgi:hypothetical protein